MGEVGTPEPSPCLLGKSLGRELRPPPRLSSCDPARARRYLQPPLLSGAARASPYFLADRPQVPGSGCGSPSSRPPHSCRIPADYTSRRPLGPHHVTSTRPAFPPEGGPRRPPAAGSAGRASGGGLWPGVCSVLGAGTVPLAAGAGSGEWLEVS